MTRKIALISIFAFMPLAVFAGDIKPLDKSKFAEEKPVEITADMLTEKPVETSAEKAAVVFLDAKEVAKHKKTIERVQDYLSGLTTITSDFMQVAPDGSLTSGKFFLQRPGMMRWQYNPPTPILMVANGSELVYYDYELEQISHIPMDSTLIGFLAQEKIRFNKSVGIISFNANAGTIRIGVAQIDNPDEGQLMLEFSDRPLLIRNMVVTDSTGKVTTVALNNANFGAKIDKELFDFRDPREKRIK